MCRIVRTMVVANVLMIGPDLNAQGGMTTVERNILDAVRVRGDSTTFLPTTTEGGKLQKLRVAIDAYLRYLSLLPQSDLVHIHMASRGSYERKRVFIKAAFRRGVPVVLHLHGSEFNLWFTSECSDVKKDEIRATLNLCKKIIVLSEEWREFFVENAVCDSNKIAVLHNAVLIPSENVVNYRSKQVLFLGRLGERKSPDTLLRAAKEVLTRHPSATFVFGGDGDIESYQKLSRQLGVDINSQFVGWVTDEDKELLFAQSAIFCLPSKNEGMPMSVLEAMAHGLATVATPVGGVPQVIDDGVDGLLIPVGDSNTLAKVLTSLLEDTAMKERIGQAGRKKIMEQFGMDAYLNKIIGIYEDVVQ